MTHGISGILFAGAAEPDQLQLFEGSIDMSKLRKKVEQMTAHNSPATRKAYASDWKDWLGWCAVAGRCPLPANGDDVACYIAHNIEELGLAVSTQERRLAAIVGAHRAAGGKVNTERARRVLSGALRAGYAQPQGKKALTVDELRRMVAALPKTPLGVRDRALLVFGFACGMRRSELVALDVADVHVSDKGVRVQVRRGKTDQDGHGREFGVFPGRRALSCPVLALKRWLKVRGAAPGPLFVSGSPAHHLTDKRLSDRAVYKLVRRSVASIGLNPDDYGGHSLRAGMVTAAAESGVPESMIMHVTGHRSIAMVAKYVRPARIWAYNPLAKAL